jgi:hypothetical protein
MLQNAVGPPYNIIISYVSEAVLPTCFDGVLSSLIVSVLAFIAGYLAGLLRFFCFL